MNKKEDIDTTGENWVIKKENLKKFQKVVDIVFELC